MPLGQRVPVPAVVRRIGKFRQVAAPSSIGNPGSIREAADTPARPAGPVQPTGPASPSRLRRPRRRRIAPCLEPVGRLWGDTGVADDDFEALYAAAYVRLVRVLAVACGSQADAEEVVQEAFVRLLPRWSRVRGYADPEAWVRGVAFRLLSNRRRGRRAAERTLARLGPEDRRAAPPDGDSVDVSRALAALTPEQRHVVVLHHLLGLPVEQVARELGVAVGTVKSRLSRGRAALAPLLMTEEHHA